MVAVKVLLQELLNNEYIVLATIENMEVIV